MKELKNLITSDGLFARIAELFTKNWGLKILALVLALVIYHSLKPTEQGSSSNHDRTTLQR